MSQDDFLQALLIDGFPPPVMVEQPANGSLDIHVHDFEVRALVVEGSIEIICKGNAALYQTGDVFHLGFKEPHSESYGPIGVKYLASRKTS